MTKEEAFGREALRALQRYDEVQDLGPAERDRLVRVQEDLGARIGLDCTGTGGAYDSRHHDGETCPIHEWVEPETDHALCADREEADRHPTPAL